MTNGITAWSHSRLSGYRKCPRQFKYRYIEKRPVVEDKSPALIRGNAVDVALQEFVERKVKKLPSELTRSLGALLPIIKAWRTDSTVSCQLERAVDKDWLPTDWFAKSTWLRAKLDVRAVQKDRILHIVDYKTGKEYPQAHQEQGEIYVAIESAFHTGMEEAMVDFYYVDGGYKTTHLFQDLKKEIPRLRKKWAKIAQPMFRDTQFKPSPGRECRWCPFSQHKGGPCEAG